MAVGGISITQGISIAQGSGSVTPPGIPQTSTSFAPDTVSTNGAGTLTAANIINGVIRTGLADGATDTSPTAAALWAAVTGATAGQTFRFDYVNTTGFPVTLAGTGGVTLSDTVGAVNEVAYKVTLTSSSAATIARAWSIAAGS